MKGRQEADESGTPPQSAVVGAGATPETATQEGGGRPQETDITITTKMDKQGETRTKVVKK